MAASGKDPAEAIRAAARRYADVVEGTSCTQTSFKTGSKSFLFIGEQGGRLKAMFKLRESMPEARGLAARRPVDFQVGSTGWVTARFDRDAPLPAALWKRWLAESHAAAAGKPAGNRRDR